MRSEADANRAIERYADTVRRICMVHLKNEADTEDIFQTVFLKYVLRSAPFASEEHEKAWFIRVTVNACKDLLKSFFRSRVVPLEQWTDALSAPEHREVLEAVLALPPKYRDVVYLHYYEGYTAAEIGKILRKNVNTVYSLLTRAMEDCSSGHGNIRCHAGSADAVSQALSHGMSVGRYRAYLILRELEPGLMLEDIQGMTTGEIYQRIREHNRENGTGSPQTVEDTCGGYAHAGSGYGHGHVYHHAARGFSL